MNEGRERRSIDGAELIELKEIAKANDQIAAELVQTEITLRQLEQTKMDCLKRKEELFARLDSVGATRNAFMARIMRKYNIEQGSNIHIKTGQVFVPGEPMPPE